jgi:enoyl-CoA hydratase/carnithine racemase
MTIATSIAPADGITLSRIQDTQIVRFDRPETANAMTIAMMEALAASIGRYGSDPATTSIILNGVPARQFLAGADMLEETDPKPAAARTRGRAALRDLHLAIVDCANPVVVALNGPAIGAGAMVALMSDTIVAAEGASLGFPEIDIGSPSPLAIALLTQLVNASGAERQARRCATGAQRLQDETVSLGVRNSDVI